MFVTMILLSFNSLGQYKGHLSSLSISTEQGVDLVEESQITFDSRSPLGPEAQLLRAESYQGKSIGIHDKGLWIKLKDEEFFYRDKKIYRFADLKCDYEEVSPRRYGKKLRKTVKSLNSLFNKSTYARNIIRTLQRSENKFTISIVNCIQSYMLVPISKERLGVLNNNAYAFQVLESEKNIVDYSPFNQIGSSAEIRWGPKHKKIKLAHELGHAYDANFGLLDDRLMQAYGMVIPAREVRALYHENMIRKELKKALRIKANNSSALVVNGMPYTYPLPVPARY